MLQEREYEKVGSSRPVKVNVRILTASHRPLEELIKTGQLREDLYYQAQCRHDSYSTAARKTLGSFATDRTLSATFAKKNGKTIRGLSHAGRNLLLRYDYPGNVRELENIIERAVILTRDDVIGSSDLPLTVQEPDVADRDRETNLTVAVEALERRMIKEALARADGVQTRAAELLGISERALRYKLTKYGFRDDASNPESNPEDAQSSGSSGSE